MQRVVSFYEKLPRGAAPEVKAKGLLGRYQARYFGKNASVTRTSALYHTCCLLGNLKIDMLRIAIIHVLAFLIGIGYLQNYYFHLRE
jgi:F-type H+-transporting ATPase subunit f